MAELDLEAIKAELNYEPIPHCPCSVCESIRRKQAAVDTLVAEVERLNDERDVYLKANQSIKNYCNEVEERNKRLRALVEQKNAELDRLRAELRWERS